MGAMLGMGIWRRHSKERMAKAVSKLLDNASRCSPDGGEIGLSVEVAGEAVVITVSDSGIGFPEEELAGVFDSIGVGVGIGTGLSVVKHWVEAHGGGVVPTKEGRSRGGQFALTLPLAREHDPRRSAGSCGL